MMLLATARVAAGQVAQPLQPDEPPNTLKGTVINAITHAPISRALVYSADNRFATFTDGEGNFEFTLPNPGQNYTNAIFENGQPRTQWNVLRAGGTFSFMARKPGFVDDPNASASQKASDNEITISLLPEGLIKGRVVSTEADLPPGISVQLLVRRVEDGVLKWTHVAGTRANSSGEFRFAELQPGTYKLVTNESMDNDPAITIPGGQQYGFPPVYHPGVSDFAAAGTIQLTAGQTAQVDIPLTRQPYYPVRIPVANAEQNGNLNVTVSVQGHRGPGYSLGYNAQNHRIEGLLPQGNYLVETTTYGPTFSYGAVNLAVAGAPTEGPSLTLIPDSSITLHVTEQFTATDSSGIMQVTTANRSFEVHGPRAYLQVNAHSADDFRQQGGSLRLPTGPNDDSLVLENLAPGRYWLQLHSSRGYVAAATMAGVDLLHEPLVVGLGSSIPIEVTMRDDTAELDGTVAGLTPPAISDASGSSVSPLQGSVYCIPLSDGPGQFQQVWVSPEGKINSTPMAPGTYRVLAFANPQRDLPYRDPEAMKLYDAKGQVVHLTAGQKTSVQLQMVPSAE
jgi:hypothetical protein